MLFLKPFVRAEGTGFVGSVSNRSIGVIVASGLVVDLDLLDTNIDGNETVVKLQGVAVEVLCHVGDGVGEELENGRRHLITGCADLNLESSGMKVM